MNQCIHYKGILLVTYNRPCIVRIINDTPEKIVLKADEIFTFIPLLKTSSQTMYSFFRSSEIFIIS